MKIFHSAHKIPLCAAIIGVATTQTVCAQVTVRPSRPATAQVMSLSLKGWTKAAYGSADAMPAVDGVEQALRALDSGRRESHQFPFDTSVAGTDSARIKSHAQGVARLAGVGDNNWLVFSKADSDRGQAGLIFVNYQLRSDGRAWKYAEASARRFGTGAPFSRPDRKPTSRRHSGVRQNGRGALWRRPKRLGRVLRCERSGQRARSFALDFARTAHISSGRVYTFEQRALSGFRGRTKR